MVSCPYCFAKIDREPEVAKSALRTHIEILHPEKVNN